MEIYSVNSDRALKLRNKMQQTRKQDLIEILILMSLLHKNNFLLFFLVKQTNQQQKNLLEPCLERNKRFIKYLIL
jgi:hypothetical protein